MNVTGTEVLLGRTALMAISLSASGTLEVGAFVHLPAFNAGERAEHR